LTLNSALSKYADLLNSPRKVSMDCNLQHCALLHLSCEHWDIIFIHARMADLQGGSTNSRMGDIHLQWILSFKSDSFVVHSWFK
jgi:hypothetical protein